MDFEDINFPVYRRYKNGKTYFKIVNPKLFEEVQLIGNRKIVKQLEARLFPERRFVHDMVYNYSAMAEAISEEEYLSVRE
ncbi:MAG TPA: hypothetical protein PLQ93_05680 [Bacteroidia bacterium]|nr:hypothetical protein [Bacteroidia bacterium]